MEAATRKTEAATTAPPPHPAGVPHEVVVRETEAQLQDLNRMRAAGMMFIDRLERRASGLLCYSEEKAFDRSGDIFQGFARVSRAVRQIIVLEQEIFGMRQPPGMRAAANANTPGAHSPSRTVSERNENEYQTDPSDLNDLNDYDNRQIELVVGRIAATLGVEPMAPGAMPAGWVERNKTHRPKPKPTHPDVSAPAAKAMGSSPEQPIPPAPVKSTGNRGPPE